MSLRYLIGIDEVGRGPVAGPLVLCACAISVGTNVTQFFPKEKLKDSKKLSEKNRKEILNKIVPLRKEKNICFGLGEISGKKIDETGLSLCIKEAVEMAINSLHEQGIPKDSFIFLDGSLHAPKIYNQETIIKGDEKVAEIALASIYAKEYRDSLMIEQAKLFPLYHFDRHVGYGTKMHYEAIKKYGLTPLHRATFLTKIK